MSKLVFYYGVMGCSKSANALMTKFQYEEKGMHVWLIKPATDTRADQDLHYFYKDIWANPDLPEELKKRISCVSSRVGIHSLATNIFEDDNIKELLPKFIVEYSKNVIICDEAQFMSAEQIDQLKDISVLYHIPVLCYGLRTDFKSNLFPGAKRLFELADEIHGLESVCDCGKPAIVNARIGKNGKILTAGSTVEIGGNEKYKPMCWECWKKEQKNK